MPGEDHVRPVADHQVLADRDAAADEAVDLGQQAGRVEHHAGGDDALHLGPEDAAGHQRELERLAVADDGMPGVGPALVADHDIVLLGQQIDDLALGLVAPLQSDHASSRHRTALNRSWPEISKHTSLARRPGGGQVPTHDGGKVTCRMRGTHRRTRMPRCVTHRYNRNYRTLQVLRLAGHHHRVHRLVLDRQLRILEAGGSQVLGIFRRR